MSLVVAHRGYSAAYPENTMLAFQKAAEAGCDLIELDVQLSRDGRLVVIHDEGLERTTGRAALVRELDYAELQALDASGRFRGRFGPNPVPSLEEYLEWAEAASISTLIELKNYLYPYPGLEAKLLKAIEDRGLGGRVIYSSFNHQSLLELRRSSPGCRIAFISGGWLIEAGDYCRRHGADYLNARSVFFNPENVAEARARGLGLMAWTVDETAELERLAGLGIDALITNEPARAREVLGRGLPAEGGPPSPSPSRGA